MTFLKYVEPLNKYIFYSKISYFNGHHILPSEIFITIIFYL